MKKVTLDTVTRTTPQGGTKPFPSVILGDSQFEDPDNWPQWTAQQQAAIQAKIGILSAEGVDF